jgi:hypothetical protein
VDESQNPTDLSVSSGQMKMEDGLNVCHSTEGRIGTPEVSEDRWILTDLIAQVFEVKFEGPWYANPGRS